MRNSTSAGGARSGAGRLPSVVYFLEDTGSGLIKIGYSGALKSRLRNLGRKGIVLRAALPGNQHTEKWLHLRFSEDRKHGEWFVLTDRLKGLIDAFGLDPRFMVQSKRTNKAGAGRPRTIKHVRNYPQCACAACRAARTIKKAANG